MADSLSTPHGELERNADTVNNALQEYLTGYEFRGDEGDHTPTESERLLIEDAIQGLMVDEDFIAAFVKMHNRAASSEKREPSTAQEWYEQFGPGKQATPSAIEPNVIDKLREWRHDWLVCLPNQAVAEFDSLVGRGK